MALLRSNAEKLICTQTLFTQAQAGFQKSELATYIHKKGNFKRKKALLNTGLTRKPSRRIRTKPRTVAWKINV
jgi:hypothetical protein